MRGSYFVKHLKGTGKSSAVDKAVESQATRTNVMNASACSKAAAKAEAKTADLNDKKLWEGAGESVIEKSKIMDEVEASMDNVC